MPKPTASQLLQTARRLEDPRVRELESELAEVKDHRRKLMQAARAAGHNFQEMADVLGVSYSTARRFYNDKEIDSPAPKGKLRLKGSE